MNWSNYLSDKKCPSPPYAHLGVLEGEVWGYWDLSQVLTYTIKENQTILQ